VVAGFEVSLSGRIWVSPEGIVETATGGDGVSRYHWTVFGYAVIGRLAPKLKNIK